MADDKNQASESDSAFKDTQDFAVRRTVIKGLASAVPVIMTVTSGEALANASSLQCITNTPTYSNTPECITKGKRDNWHRQTAMVQDSDGNSVEKECLVYADEWGNALHKDAGGKPFTHSCYNSFLPYK